MLHGLDLFTGIGGISVALAPWVRTVCYVEIDAYAQAVIQSRIRSGDLHDAPVWDDVTTFDSAPWRGRVDIIFGGFPCQDISVAGRGAGLEGKRSGLFFEIVRLAREIRPAFLFLENVPAIAGRGLDTVAREISALGYDLRWGVLSAFDVGAPHLRERWFMLASDANRIDVRNEYATGTGRSAPEFGDDGTQGALADAIDKRRRPRSASGCDVGRENHGDSGRESHDSDSQGKRRCKGESESMLFIGLAIVGSDWWQSEPDVGRVAHGVPKRVDRIRCLGNAVVPAQAREAFRRLAGFKAGE